jgi:hypothetical protein
MIDVTPSAAPSADTALARGGRFVTGGKPGPGRPKGSRNALAEDFLRDLRDAWNEHGREALARTARDEPGVFIRVVSSIMPRDLAISMTVDVNNFTHTFRSAVEMLGNGDD